MPNISFFKHTDTVDSIVNYVLNKEHTTDQVLSYFITLGSNLTPVLCDAQLELENQLKIAQEMKMEILTTCKRDVGYPTLEATHEGLLARLNGGADAATARFNSAMAGVCRMLGYSEAVYLPGADSDPLEKQVKEIAVGYANLLNFIEKLQAAIGQMEVLNGACVRPDVSVTL